MTVTNPGTPHPGRRTLLGGMAAVAAIWRTRTAAANHKRGHPPTVHASLVRDEPRLQEITDALESIAASYDGTDLSIYAVGEAAEQAGRLMSAQQQGADVLLVMPYRSPALAQMLESIVAGAAEGQLFVVFGRDRAEVEGAFLEVVVTRAAVVAAQADWVAANRSGGTVIALTFAGSEAETQDAIDRHNLSAAFNVRVEPIEFDQAAVAASVQSLLAAAPDTVAILTPFDMIASWVLGASVAVAPRAVVMGVGASPEMLATIRDGAPAVTVDRRVVGQARVALTTVLEYLFNDTAPAGRVLSIRPLVITRDNIETAEAWPLVRR